MGVEPHESVLENDPPRDEGDVLEVGLRAIVPPTARGLDRALGLERLFMALEVTEPKVLHIGRYEVIERLGQGGMGSVYRARDPELQRDVAIKLLHREVTPEETESIRREAKVLASLAHANVVRVYDLGITGGQLYVAMQYVPGKDLRCRVLARDRPTWQETLAMFIAAGRGLAAAHAAGVVHRDFKAENVLVGDDGAVLLADFGLAQHGDFGQTGMQMAGTYEYMAPEIYRGEPADVRSDQYSFCAAVWRTLDPTSEPGTTSEVMNDLVQRCLRRGLARDPQERWPSMDVLLGALEQALLDRPHNRQRALLLERVERSWIAGVLRKALDGHPLLSLPMNTADHLVDSPWSALLQGSSGTPCHADGLPTQLERGHGSLLILGRPGAGKTMTLLALADRLARQARLDAHARAPVVLNLSSFSGHAGSLLSWVEEELVTKYSLPRKTVTGWLEDDALTLLLDGLDEVSPPARRKHCIEALNAFRNEHPIPLVVACRTDDYASAGARLAFGAAVEVQPLPADVVRGALSAEVASSEGLLADPSLRTPLMLSLLREAGVDIRSSRDLRALYDAYLERSFMRNEVSARERRVLLAGLRWLAAALERAGTTEVWIEQLSTAWFERPLQRLFGKALGLAFVFLVAMLGLAVVTLLTEGTLSGAPLGICCATFAVIFNRGTSVKPVGRLRWSWRRAGRWLPIALLIGLGLGALYGLFYVLWVNIIFGGAVGVLCALSIGLEPALLESPVRPNQGILQSGYTALMVGLASAVIGGGLLGYGILPFMLPHLGPESTLYALEDPCFSVFVMGGAAAGLTIALLHGGTAVLLHWGLRLVVGLSTPLPLHLVSFLRRATGLALLRRVGGGYIFMHRTLQEHLAAP